MTVQPKTVALYAMLGALIAFAMYRRFRRTFGRQLVTPKRMTARVVLFGIAGAVMLSVYFSPTMLLAAAAGAIPGAVLGLVGIHYTRIEATADGRYYTPNAWVGGAVSALFLTRVAGRLVTIYQVTSTAAASGEAMPVSGLKKSPLTLAIFVVLVGYYGVYYSGVLRRARQVAPASVPAKSAIG